MDVPSYETKQIMARVSGRAWRRLSWCVVSKASGARDSGKGPGPRLVCSGWTPEGTEHHAPTDTWTVIYRAFDTNPYSIETTEFSPLPCIGQFSTAGDLSSGLNRAWAPDLYDYLLELFTVKGES